MFEHRERSADVRKNLFDIDGFEHHMVPKIGHVGLVAALVWSPPADGQSLGGTRSATPTDPGTHAISVAPSEDRSVLMFFGTSLTAGLGLEPDQAYPAL